MNQSTFNETFAFFSERLSKAVGVEEQEVVLSVMSHLVAWMNDHGSHYLCRDHFFVSELLPEFEAFLKGRETGGCTKVR